MHLSHAHVKTGRAPIPGMKDFLSENLKKTF